MTSSIFGGITIGTVYYVYAIPSSTTFSISATRGGSQLNLSTGNGTMSVRLREVSITSCTNTAMQIAVSLVDTNAFFKVGRAIRFENPSGSMFCGVSSGSTYYINSIIGTTIGIALTASGSAVSLTATPASSNLLFLSSPDEYPGPLKSNVNNQTWFYHEYLHLWPPSSCSNCDSYFAQYRIETTSGGGPATTTLFIDEVRLSQREDCSFAYSTIPALVGKAWIEGNTISKAWKSVSLGWDHSCAIDVTSALYCWGRNQEGQVGDGSITDVSRPRPVTNLPAPVASFSLGRFHTCAVSSGALYCWGAFSTTSSVVNYGQSGAYGSVTPMRVGGILSLIRQVTCGKLHTCALDSLSSVWCFGRNYNGQLGTGSTINVAFPSRVLGLPNVESLAKSMKGESTCVITSQRSRWCWGENNFGQLGDSTAVGRYEPVGGVAALVRIEPSGMFSLKNGMQFLIYSNIGFGVSPYTICSGVQLQAKTNSSVFFFYDFTCSWLDPTVIEAIFYYPPFVNDSDYFTVSNIPQFDVVLTTANAVFSGVSIAVFLRIDSINPSIVTLNDEPLMITVFSNGFVKLTLSHNEPCTNAFVGRLSVSMCSWDTVTGTVRLQLFADPLTSFSCALLQVPSICSLSPDFQNCSAIVSFVLSNRTFRSNEIFDSSWLSINRLVSPSSDAQTTGPVDYTLATILGILCSVVALLGTSMYLWFARKRAMVSRSVEDVIWTIQKLALDVSGESLKSMSALDDRIKQLMSDSEASLRICEVILTIVSQQIYSLGPSPQHLWCVLVSSSLESSSLEKLNEFLDDKRHVGRIMYLAHGCHDLQGRIAIQVASKPCRDCLEARFLFMSRFDVNLDKSQYISSTSRVVIASEKITAANGGETIVRKVALKFMKNKDQFMREKESRDFFKDLDNFVVGIHHTFTTEDKQYKVALENSYFRDFKDYPFLLVMPSADCDLKSIISGENVAGRAIQDFSQVKPILQAMLTCVLHLHNAGVIHGDIKPRNIMRTGGINSFLYRLIDFDASACLPSPIGPNPPPTFCTRFVGAKSSSMYSPPELISMEDGRARVKEFHITPSGECVASGSYALVQASVAHDMWSIGAVLYELFTNETLFHGNSVSDNIDPDELHILANWTDEIKSKKLLKVPNISLTKENTSKHPNFARNLLSILLMKDPANRPLSIAHVLEHPLFRDGKSPGRLLGEKAKYDFFLSYRVSATADADLIAGIWKVLTERGYQVFWDKQELHKGREWEGEFCEGLVCSHVFVPLLSQAAIKNPTNNRANFENLKEDSDCDNVLLEHRLALELKGRGFIKSIMPLLIGRCNDDIFDRFSFAQLPSELPSVQVRALETKLREHLNNHCLGTPYDEYATVQDVFKKITAFQGHRVEGQKDAAILTVVEELQKLRTMDT